MKLRCVELLAISVSEEGRLRCFAQGSRFLKTEVMTLVVGFIHSGVFTVAETGGVLTKFATSVQGGDCIERLLKNKELSEKHQGASLGIGHTRWATCGSKDDINAHPHHDQDKKVYIVHNGTILNYRRIKENLQNQGVVFYSETDSEVIAQLIAQEFKACKDPKKAIIEAVGQLEGTYGLVIIFTDLPGKLFCLELGSHLVVGIGEKEVFVGSEARAFQEYTLRRIEVEENKLIEIGKNSKGEYGIINFEANIVSPKGNQKDFFSKISKGNYSTFLEKEIFEQDEAVFNAIGKNSRIDTIHYTAVLQGLQQYEEEMAQIKNIYIFGCGSSHISASMALHFFRMINNFDSVQVFDPSDFSEYDMPTIPETVGIFISQSGETRDVIQVQQMFKKKGIITMGICNGVGSKLSKETDFGVYLHAGHEQAVPSTKTFLSSMIVQILVALWFSHKRHKLSFMKFRKETCLGLLSLSACVSRQF
jgi:glucosamine--fructose-6-phosphate aminotransferase (isomerizing)